MQNEQNQNNGEFSEELWQSNAEPAPVKPAPTEQKAENIPAGIVGAFLFSLIGAALYFIIYQIGYIAGICGFLIVILAGFGYQLFSGKKNSLIGIITSVVMLLVMIPLAEYVSLGYAVYDAFGADPELAISFFDAMRIVPEVTTEMELWPDVLKEIGIGYLLGILASASNISVALRNRKAARAAANAPVFPNENTDSTEE